ncbi:MAG: copper homeostasis periplasmic binding protein CopC [Caulobacteraceae bacterium]
MFKPLLSKTALLRACAVFGSLAIAGGAQAHAHLMASTPAANASGPSPAQIALKFSEAPLAKFSGIMLLTASGGAVEVKPLKSADRNALMFAPATLLKPGVYSVKWHAVTADTHRTQGAFTFTVR